MSQPGIEPGTSCTAGEQSMQKALQTAYKLSIGISPCAATFLHNIIYSFSPVSARSGVLT